MTDNACNSSGMAKYHTLFVLYLGMWLIVFVPSVSDSTQPSSSILGPNGVNCIIRTDVHGSFYDHIDGHGLQCPCTFCRPGDVLIKNCTCDPNNLELPHMSECRVVPKGQFMNSSNFCSRGFECKKCLHPLEVTHNCRPRGPDTVCGCVDGYYMTSPDTCLPLPKCDAEYEPTPGHGDHGTEIRCTHCHVGYFQPNNNSTRTCKKIRQCTVQQGTPRSDAECLNDRTLEPIQQPTTGTLEPIQQPTIGYVTTEEPIEPDKPSVTTTPEPTPGYDEITSVGNTTHPTPKDTGGPPYLNALWILCLVCFLFGIGVGVYIQRQYAQRGSSPVLPTVLPNEANQLMGGLREQDDVLIL